jgi:hypothetical protein
VDRPLITQEEPQVTPIPSSEAPRLPVLREPLGWRSLGLDALAARVWTLWSAGRHRPDDGQELVAMVACHVLPGEADPPVGSALTPPTSPAPWQPAARLIWALPWLALAVGLGISVPVLIWAPLLGGVCLGLVLLQVSVIRRWARVRARRLMGQDGSAHETGTDPGGGDSTRLAKPRQSEGWLLAGFLGLAALLAGILLFTLNLQNRKATGLAEAMRVQRQSAALQPPHLNLPPQPQRPPPETPAEQLPQANP